MIRAEQTAVLVADTDADWNQIRQIAAAQSDAGATVILDGPTRTATISLTATLNM